MVSPIRSHLPRRRFVAGISTAAIPLIAGCADDGSATVETDELPEIEINDVPGISDTGFDDPEAFLDACEDRLLEHDFQLDIHIELGQSSEPRHATVDWDSQASLTEVGPEGQVEHRFTTPAGQVVYAGDPTIRLDTTFEDISRDIVAEGINAAEEALSLFEFGEPTDEENQIRLPVIGIQDEQYSDMHVENGELIVQEHELFSALNVVLGSENNSEWVFDIEITAGEITLDTPGWAQESVETLEQRDSHDPEVVDRVADVSSADSVRIDVEIDDNRTTLIEQQDVVSVQQIGPVGSSQGFFVSVYLDGTVIDHFNETVAEVGDPRDITRITVLDGSDIASETLGLGLHNQIRTGQWQTSLLGFRFHAPDETTAEQIAATLIDS